MREFEVVIDYEKIVGLPIPADKVKISKGLITHVQKKHSNMLKYYPKIEEIVNNPDYYGFNLNQPSNSFECIKILEDNVLVAIKLDRVNDYYYVASLYGITDSKLKHMKNNGRIIKFDDRFKT